MNVSFALPRAQDRQPGKNYFLLDMRDPQKRRAFLDVLLYREYEQSLADWEPSNPGKFAFYVRKDVAAQSWDFGLAPAGVTVEREPQPYARTVALPPVLVLGGQGTGEGQFSAPRNVAFAPDGAVVVADSGNHRIQTFAADGTFLAAWGDLCKVYEDKKGCRSSDGAGQFHEPWGVAVDADGFVYVADTWNHRVQKFTPDGEFVTMWGQFGAADAPGGWFWGPRDVVVAGELVYVSDTGNKRIQLFTTDGQFVTAWGGQGIGSGQFDEPVGIGLDNRKGELYIADTWNRRLLYFDADRQYVREWPVESWSGQSLQNKPYLAVDARGRVYATDPEAGRILVFNDSGAFLGSIVSDVHSGVALVLPTGIDVDEAGYILVADPGTHQVIKLMPLQS